MPWRETNPVNERQQFVLAYLKRDYPFTALCGEFGVSRKTGYKWVSRFMQGGLVGLADESRARDTMKHRTPLEVAALIIDTRRSHPTWGPKKIVRRLRELHPALEFPALSTAGNILKKEGLVLSVRKRHRLRFSSVDQLRPLAGPNSTWATDFKGEFPLRNEQICYPLTLTDLFSRKLLRCEALTSTTGGPAMRVLESAFREFGLPSTLRMDNGTPFRNHLSALKLSLLCVWLIELGINPEFISPGKPQQNGSHERMHRTLKAEAVSPPSSGIPEQQRRFDQFRREYNADRPHEGIALRTPDSIYVGSARRYPKQRPQASYGPHLHIRLVSGNGQIRWGHTQFGVARILRGKRVALEHICDGLLRVQFYSKVIGMFDEEDRTFIPNLGWCLPESDV